MKEIPLTRSFIFLFGVCWLIFAFGTFLRIQIDPSCSDPCADYVTLRRPEPNTIITKEEFKMTDKTSFYVVEDKHGVKRIHKMETVTRVTIVGMHSEHVPDESTLMRDPYPIFFKSQYDYENYLAEFKENVIEVIEKETNV